jgi:[acyl-carrier-protein] S-malonyltransferase
VPGIVEDTHMRTAEEAGQDAPAAVVFPGQGAQQPGMGKAWRESESWPLTEQIAAWTGVDIEHLLLTADESELRRTDCAQLGVFTVGVLAYAEASRSGALAPVVAYAGHSLGEYTALYAAGAVGLREAALLVAERGAAMLEAARRHPGTMAAVTGENAGSGGGEQLAAACRRAGHQVWVANHNGPHQVVLSGTYPGIAAAEELAADTNLRCGQLPVGGAFHSPLMAPAARRLGHVLSATPFAAVHAPVVANIDGRPYTHGGLWPGLMTAQLTGAVRWDACMRTLTETLGARRLLALGLGRTLAGLAKRIDPSLSVVSVRTPDQLANAGHVSH